MTKRGELKLSRNRKYAVFLVTVLVAFLCTAIGDGFAFAYGLVSNTQPQTKLAVESWGKVLQAKLPSRIKGDPKLVISPNYDKDRTAVLATQYGVYATVDGGNTWKCIGFQNQDITAIAISPNFENNVSGAIYVATSIATTPKGVIGNGFYGNSSLWFIENVTSEVWLPTRVYQATIDALAVNPSEDVFMSVPSGSGLGYWLEWTAGSEGEPTVDSESPGLYVSADVGLSWSMSLFDEGACGLAFDPYGTGYFTDRNDNQFVTFNSGQSWEASPSSFPYGSLSNLTFASWSSNGSSSKPGSYLMGIASPYCGGTSQSTNLIYQGQSLTSIYDQVVSDVSGDFPFAIPGHNRGIVFASTPKGVYLGGEDSNGDFWTLLSGSPQNVETICAGKNSAGEPVVFAFDGSSFYKLTVSWPLSLPRLGISTQSFQTPVIEGHSTSAAYSVSSIDGWSGEVKFVNPDDQNGVFDVTTSQQAVPSNAKVNGSFTLSTSSSSPPGAWTVFPTVADVNDSSYAGGLRKSVTVIPPPVYISLSSLSPGNIALRAGQSATATFTVSRGPNWTSSFSTCSFGTSTLKSGITATFSQSTISLGNASSAVDSVTISSTQSVAKMSSFVTVIANCQGANSNSTLHIEIGSPLPTSFRFIPSSPSSLYRYQSSNVSIEALGTNGQILSDYSGFLGELKDSLNGLDGIGIGSTDLNFVNGIAKTGYFLASPGVDKLIVLDKTGAPISGSNPFDVELPPVKFVISKVANQTIGSNFSLTVDAVDSNDHVVSLYDGDPYILDKSGFLYQKTGDFKDGLLTTNVSIPVVIKNDTIEVGDQNGAPFGSAFYGSSNTFDVLLPAPLTSPGEWNKSGYSAGKSYYNPKSFLSAQSFKQAKIEFSLPYTIPRSCAPPYTQYMAPVCKTFKTLSGGSFIIGPGNIDVTNGLLVPIIPEGFSAETGQFLWGDHFDSSSNIVSDGSSLYTCNENLDNSWWSNPYGGLSPSGLESFSDLGSTNFGPLAKSSVCANLTSHNGVLYAVSNIDTPTNFNKNNVNFPQYPFTFDSYSESNGATLFSLKLPTNFGQGLWDPVAGGSYAASPVIRVTETPQGDVGVVANCEQESMMAGVCRTDDYPITKSYVPLKMYAERDGRWIWENTYVKFPYGKNLTSNIFDSNVPAFWNSGTISQFVSISSNGKYSSASSVEQHLDISRIFDIAASAGVIYLSVEVKADNELNNQSSSPMANGVIAIDANTGKPIWDKLIWGPVGLELVITNTSVVLASQMYSTAGVAKQNATSPNPKSYKDLGTSVISLAKGDGQVEYLQDELPRGLYLGPHASAGGGLLFLDGDLVIDITDGQFLGYLPNDNSCFNPPIDNSNSSPTPQQQAAAKAAGTSAGQASTVAVAGNWIYYLSCGDEKITAVKMPTVNPAYLLAQQAYEIANDPLQSPGIEATYTTASKARYAEIAEQLFKIAGDSSMAQKAGSLAKRLNYQPLPTAPPRPLKVPPLSKSLVSVSALTTANKLFPYKYIAGGVVGLLIFIPLRRKIWKSFHV